MANKVFFKLIVLLTGLMLQFNVWSQVSKTVHVATAGTLSSLLGTNYMQITDLTVTGNLDSRDIRIIRYMAGSNYQGDATDGKLTNLNLSGAKIVSFRQTVINGSHHLNTDGSTCYYMEFVPNNYANYYHTSNNSISAFMFYRTKLTSVTIPSNLTSIERNAFRNCSELISITIPNSVISIGDYAFADCSYLTSVFIGKSVKSIEKQSFSWCGRLSEIHSGNPTPPTLSGISFSQANITTCILYVPIGSKSVYQSANEWKDFMNIIEETYTALNTAIKENSAVRPISNGISIETKGQTIISVYNISGQKVYQSIIDGKGEIYLNRGVYIVDVNNKSQKILIQ